MSGRRLPGGRSSRILIGTWNVRTLNEVGKLENLKKEMRRMNLDVMGISEMRWPEEKDFWTDEYRMINTAGKKGQAGVGIIMNKVLGKRVQSYIQYNERVLLVRIEAKPVDLVIVQVYMPTGSYKEEEIEEVYEELEEVLSSVKGKENLIIMGDWNARVGAEKEEGICGEYGLGERNERGSRLIEFCEKHKIVIANTLFKNHRRRRYTWKKPGGEGRFQIDYIMTRRRYRNEIIDCKTYPGADIGSDHNLVVMKCKLGFKKMRRREIREKFDLEVLRETRRREEYQKEVTERLSEHRKENSIEGEWKVLKESIIQAAKSKIGVEKRKRKKPWMKEEILQLMEERRKYKQARDEEGKRKYRALRNEIRRECKKAKEEWINKRCEEIEERIKTGRADQAYSRVKRYFGIRRKKTSNLKDEKGELLSLKEEKAERWVRYVEKLYENKTIIGRCIEREDRVEEEERGDPILRSEFDKALKEMNVGKAVGVDEIACELIKNAGEEALKRLFQLICRMYEEGEVPIDFQKSKLVMIPKKAKASKCEDYRTISLLSHASKILTRIIHKRIQSKVEENIGEDQFGFRKGKGTREAILSLRIILEKRLKKGLNTYVAFVDLEKAFDNVEWTRMFKVLKEIGIKFKERRAIWNLYKEQKAEINVEEEVREAKIQKGVRQGCCLSPILFNLYIEKVIEEMNERKAGISIQGYNVRMIRFADDIAILEESERGLEETLKRLDSKLRIKYKMRMNKTKTKVMVVSRWEQNPLSIKVGGEKFEEVREFKYLGGMITQDGRSKREIKSRLEQAKKAFFQKGAMFKASINLKVRLRFLKAYIWSLALYGCETWTIGTQEKKSIEAFEMWCYRRMLKIKWTEKVRNKEVLERMGVEQDIWKMIVKRRVRMIGHNLRHPGILAVLIEGMVEGKNWKGRQRMSYEEQIMKDTGCKSYLEMKRLAYDRVKWRDATH